jgi:8-oxo-dGTP pyrophosphatase MutT (NUDIX family)
VNANQTVITAGIYVNAGGYFPFQVGPTKAADRLGVVRLGGHREGNESGWECATREALEEACLRVTLLHPPATYWIEGTSDAKLQPGGWISNAPDEVAPIVVTKRDELAITPIYLGYSEDTPTPAGEVKALLLLQPREIHLLTSNTLTLGQYLDSGGKAIFRDILPHNILLEPYPHLRILDRLLQLHPEIAMLDPSSFTLLTAPPG